MLRLLLTPRWVLLLVGAAVFAVACGMLGSWQWSRHLERLEVRDTIRERYDAAPRDLAEVLADPPDELSWTRVTASGRYAGDDQVLVRNRPLSGTFGYEVLVPLETTVGTLVVDRGWVPNAADAATLPEVPPAPADEVRVTGWLRPTEPSLSRDLPAGQVASIQLSEVAGDLGREVLPAYLVLEAEDTASGAAVPRPTPLAEPDTGLRAHLAYAIQWWLTAPLGLVMVMVLARREVRARADVQAGDRSGSFGDDAGDALVSSGARSARSRRTRIWDEEDE